MENVGLINRYVCDGDKHAFHTINLNVGTAPFTTMCLECKCLAQSSGYSIRSRVKSIKYGWYRPTPNFLSKLNANTQRHVLNGGLVLGVLGQITPTVDPVKANWEFKDWQRFVADFYSETVPRMP
jgi:hypothetical protein